jgi:hypothetical protein
MITEEISEERKEEIKKNLSILQPHVTAFSAQLSLNSKHGDEVRVGGKVVSVFDSNRLDMNFDAPYGESIMPTEDTGVYLTVNDELGEVTLVVFQSTYRRILADSGGESLIGKWVVGKGEVAVLDKSMQFITNSGKLVTADSHPVKEVLSRVFCHGMELIQTEA